MKHLLVVITLFVCVQLSSAFSDAKNYHTAGATKNFHSRILQSKNSAWVNPWTNVKRLSTNTCVTVVDAVSGRVPTKCSIDFYGVPIPISTQHVMWHNIPPGTMVTLRFEIAANPSLGQGFYVLDDTTGEFLYETEDATATYQWLTVAGHIYYVYFYY